MSGVGPQPASILMVGEGPGEEEELRGEPFVGESGRLLEQLMTQVGLRRSQVRITNIVRCRPVDKAETWKDRKTGKMHYGNTAPTLEQIYVCAPTFLEEEIKATNPVVIVPIGNTALRYILGEYSVIRYEKSGEQDVPKLEKKLSKIPAITAERGIERWSDKYQCKVIPIIHPAALLRNPRQITSTVEDLRRIVEASKVRTQREKIDTNYVLVDQWEDLQQVMRRLLEVEAVAVDVETDGLDFLRHKIITIGLSWCAGTAVCIQWLDATGKCIWTPDQQAEFIVCMTKVFSNPKKLIIGHNLKFDFQMLMNLGIPAAKWFYDTMLAHHMWDPEAPHGLDNLAWLFTDMGGYEKPLEEYQSEHPTSKKNYLEIPFQILGTYNCGDADCTFRSAYALMAKMAERPKSNAFFNEWVLPFSEAVREMEREGIGLDFELVRHIHDSMQERLNEVQAEFMQHLGLLDINLGSSKQLAKLFFDDLKMPVIRRSEKTNLPSLDEEVVLELAKRFPDNKALKLLLEYRGLQKTMSTYCIGLKDAALFGRFFGTSDVPTCLSRNYWTPAEARNAGFYSDGRVHCDFLIHGTAAGRLSAQSPNLQNLKRVTKEDQKRGWMIRNCLVARPGFKFVEADFKQGEVFVAASLSRDANLIHDMLSEEGVHRQVYSRIFGVPVTEVSDEQKVVAKGVVFGTFYGQQAEGLAELLKVNNVIVPLTAEDENMVQVLLSRKTNEQVAREMIEAQARLRHSRHIINTFFEKYRALKYWIDTTIDRVRKEGKVETLFGRTRYLPAINSNDLRIRANAEHQAINTPIQGTCHDALIVAAVKIQREIEQRHLPFRLVMEVHDMVMYEVPDTMVDECADLLTRKVEEPIIPELIPLKAEISVGSRWKEKKEDNAPVEVAA